MDEPPRGETPQTLVGSLIGTLRRWRNATSAWTRANVVPATRRIADFAGPPLRATFESIGRVLVAASLAVWRRLPRIRSAAAAAGTGVIVATADDDAASVIGRIDTADEVDLVLMVPRSVRKLRDAAAWPHVAAHVRRRGIELGVVAARRDVRALASDNGLRTAGSARALRRQRIRTLRIGAREFQLPRMRALGALRWLVPPALVAVGIGAACYTLPTAQIVIVPPAEPFSGSAVARVDAVADKADAAAGVLPGVTVRLTFSIVLATGTTGSTELGDEPATVELRLRNEGDAPVRVAEDALAATEDGITFRVAVETDIPAGETATVDALAERPGEIGNVDADQLWVLSGAPRTLDVANPSAASGGTNRTVAAVALEDVERLRALAPDVLARVGGRRLVEAVESGTVFEETVIITIMGEDPFANLDQPEETFLMEFTAVVSALSVPHEQAKAFGEELLRASLPEGMALLPRTTTVEFDDDRTYEAGEIRLSLTATGLAFELFEPSAMQGGLKGARPDDAARTLQERLGLAERPRVTIEPDWLPWIWLPRRGSQIAITFEGPSQEKATSGESASTQ